MNLGLVANIAIGIAFVSVICLLCARYLEHRGKEQQFCADCLSYGITDAINPGSQEKQQRLQLLAKKYGLNGASPERLQKLLSTHISQKDLKDKAEQAEKHTEEVQAEQAKFELLNRYAGLRKNDKPARMLEDLAQAAILETRGSRYIPMKKESDGAVLAGIASGIGGIVPALMSFSNTERINQEIRSQNEAAKAINDLTSQLTRHASYVASEYRKEAKKLAVKVTAELPREELFAALTFQTPSVTVSPLGSITVQTAVTADPELKIFDGLPAFVDGSINAEIYDGEEKIGETVMVFPALGSIAFHIHEEDRHGREYIVFQRDPGAPVLLEGMCLNCGRPDKSYTVKLTPRDLWAVEQ